MTGGDEVAEKLGIHPDRHHRNASPCGGDVVVALAMKDDRLLEGRPSLSQTAQLMRRVRPALEQACTLRMPGWSELESLGQAPLRALDVERECPFRGEGEAADCRRL